MLETVDVVRERERESNRLEKIALFCSAKNKKEYITNKDKYAWIKHKITNKNRKCLNKSENKQKENAKRKKVNFMKRRAYLLWKKEKEIKIR